MKLWHGSSGPIEKFDGDALTGMVHLGSLAQAAMRSGGRHLHIVEISMERVRRLRDTGVDKRPLIEKARRSGFDGIVYLNRYEGISTESLEAVLRDHPSLDLDRIPDSRFRKLFPEARDSFISFDPHVCRIVAYFPTRKEAEAFLAGEVQGTLDPDGEAPEGPS